VELNSGAVGEVLAGDGYLQDPKCRIGLRGMGPGANAVGFAANVDARASCALPWSGIRGREAPEAEVPPGAAAPARARQLIIARRRCSTLANGLRCTTMYSSIVMRYRMPGSGSRVGLWPAVVLPRRHLRRWGISIKSPNSASDPQISTLGRINVRLTRLP